jgi:hypothetical protein
LRPCPAAVAPGCGGIINAALCLETPWPERLRHPPRTPLPVRTSSPRRVALVAGATNRMMPWGASCSSATGSPGAEPAARTWAGWGGGVGGGGAAPAHAATLAGTGGLCTVTCRLSGRQPACQLGPPGPAAIVRGLPRTARGARAPARAPKGLQRLRGSAPPPMAGGGRSAPPRPEPALGPSSGGRCRKAVSCTPPRGGVCGASNPR